MNRDAMYSLYNQYQNDVQNNNVRINELINIAKQYLNMSAEERQANANNMRNVLNEYNTLKSQNEQNTQSMQGLLNSGLVVRTGGYQDTQGNTREEYSDGTTKMVQQAPTLNQTGNRRRVVNTNNNIVSDTNNDISSIQPYTDMNSPYITPSVGINNSYNTGNNINNIGSNLSGVYYNPNTKMYQTSTPTIPLGGTLLNNR